MVDGVTVAVHHTCRRNQAGRLHLFHQFAQVVRIDAERFFHQERHAGRHASALRRTVGISRDHDVGGVQLGAGKHFRCVIVDFAAVFIGMLLRALHDDIAEGDQLDVLEFGQSVQVRIGDAAAPDESDADFAVCNCIGHNG